MDVLEQDFPGLLLLNPACFFWLFFADWWMQAQVFDQFIYKLSIPVLVYSQVKLCLVSISSEYNWQEERCD